MMRWSSLCLLTICASLPQPALAELCGTPDASPGQKYEQLTAVEKQPETFRSEQYIALRDRSRMITWTFTQAAHPAHPAVICRRIVGPEGALRLEMNANCTASKPACDALIAEFERMNARMIEEMKRQPPKQ